MIVIKNLHLSFGEKTLIDDFSVNVHDGARVAIMGRNGSGKTTLLKYLNEHNSCLYIPQFIESDGSGGERFMEAFNLIQKELRTNWGHSKQVLLLDEPTNHLDERNRKRLFRELQRYYGTLICISHDVELLRTFHIFWHIDNGAVHVFRGDYSDYLKERAKQKIENEQMHKNLIKEQDRLKDQYRKVQERAQGNNSQRQRKRAYLRSLMAERNELADKMEEMPNIDAQPLKFWLNGTPPRHPTPICIRRGSISYGENKILDDISLAISYDDQILIKGDNGSGKTTLLKALMGDPSVEKSGSWKITCKSIGYFDQHYSNLDPNLKVLDTFVGWDITELRRYLSGFLFRNNEDVTKYIRDLSGGEKARLSLAKISAQSPQILILDEITNNIDLETREHLLRVLKEYKGIIILISHDTDFVKQLGVKTCFMLDRGKLVQQKTY